MDCLHELRLLIAIVFIVSWRMFNRIITDPEQVPVPQHQRKSTDVICTIIGAILALTLFIIAIINFSPSATQQAYFNFNQPNQELSYADYSGFKLTFWMTLIIGVSLGLIWLAIAHLAPLYAPYIALIGAIIACLVIGVFAFIVSNDLFNGQFWLRILLAVIALLFIVSLIAYLCLYRNQLHFQGIMLKYGARFLSENPSNFLYLPFFLLLIVGLFALFLFQHICFSNIRHVNNNFFDFANPGVLGILNILELLWGLQFIRDAFVFIISGNSADWYWHSADERHSSFHRLICNNWGSVVAGSFMNAFLRLPANLIELCICHPTSCCGKCGNCCYNNCSWCSSFFGLVRTDAYSYINLFGNPYCDSARECEKLCNNSGHFQGFQSPSRNYRIVAGVLLVALGVILSYLILRYRVAHIGLWFCIDLIFTLTAAMSLFTSLHASAAEGAQTSFLIQNYLSSGYDYMQHCIPSYRKQLQALSRTEHRDGKF